jgi:tRNA threonylcarbamoyladenosine biosynthesis protein TsaB
MPLILNIETGTEVCSVALSRSGRLISLRENSRERNHAQELGIYIKDLFEENQIDADDLDAVAVGMGPGSYTGLRIGVSMAKGICYGTNIPLIAVSSLRSMVRVALEEYEAGLLDIDALDTASFCPMIDARRMEVYTQLFNYNVEELSKVKAEIIDNESFLQYADGREFVIFGNGAAKCTELLPDAVLVSVSPSARGIVRLAEESFNAGKFEDIAYFEPFYLKEFLVIPSKKKLL